MIPGDPERQSLIDRGEHGIPIDEQTWREILDAAESVGITESGAIGMVENEQKVAS